MVRGRVGPAYVVALRDERDSAETVQGVATGIGFDEGDRRAGGSRRNCRRELLPNHGGLPRSARVRGREDLRAIYQNVARAANPEDPGRIDEVADEEFQGISCATGRSDSLLNAGRSLAEAGQVEPLLTRPRRETEAVLGENAADYAGCISRTLGS
jgi:hypothetical protein